jgi:probable F420-dependent oxidoreductase
MGIDIISLPEHVVMGEDLSGYPYNPRVFIADTEFYEPMVLMGMLAGRTSRIILSTGVLLLPLRPATLIAKQIATLDVLSGGRVQMGMGVGWQKAEYDFQGLPWDGRFGRMMETIEACRLLWSECPATYHGKYVNFDRAYSKPFPVQGANLPILLGVSSSDINLDRVAKSCEGWAPLDLSDDELRRATAKIRERMVAYGRDPNTFRLKLTLPALQVDGKANLDASLAELQRYADLGCTEMAVRPRAFCAGPQDYEGFLRKVIAARDSLKKRKAA